MELQLQFKEVVENIFNRWTALKLAVEHGMAGQNGLQVKKLTRAFIFDFPIKCLVYRRQLSWSTISRRAAHQTPKWTKRIS